MRRFSVPFPPPWFISMPLMSKLPAPLQQVDRTWVRVRRKKLSYFGGCDYFRLASHPAVLKGLQAALKKYGLNVAASRLTTGNHRLYELLEKRLADFFGVESASLVSNGYVTNLVVAQALAGNFSHVLIDARAHASLLDAAQILDCPILTFQHRDAADAARCVDRCGRLSRPILLTDGLFSHDGSVAPLSEYLRALPAEGMVLVDDAHGAGTLGKTGQGTPEYLGVSRERIIQTITLSKAFGAYGGAILGPRGFLEKIIERSRIFVGNTPLPLPLAAAALEAVRILKADRSLRTRLARNSRLVKNALGEAGWSMADTPGPILSLVPQDGNEAAALRRRLLAAGIYPPFIQYPGGPASGYFRFALSSEHSQEQLEDLLRVLLQHRRSVRPVGQASRLSSASSHFPTVQ